MTTAEKTLWLRLRGEELGVPFRRQHPVGPYVLDFFCAPLHLAIVVDGYQHGFDDIRLVDARRSAFLAERKIVILRFRNDEVLENLDGVVETIWNVVQKSNGDMTPTPTLPLAGGGSAGGEGDA